MKQTTKQVKQLVAKKPKSIQIRWAFAAAIITSMTIASNLYSATTLQKAGSRFPDYTQISQSQWVNLRATAKDPSHKVYAMLATGENSRAFVAAKAFLQQRPGQSSSYLALATASIMNGDRNLAEFYAKQVLKKESNNPKALNILGLSALVEAKQVSDFKVALNYFYKSRSISSSLNAGHLLLELGSAERAHNTFAQANNRCGGCAPALIGMGIAKRRLGDHKSAKSLFEQALDKDKDQYAAQYNLALSLIDGYQEYDDAKEILQAILRKAPPRYSAIRTRADAVMHQLMKKQLNNLNEVKSTLKPDYKRVDHDYGFGGLED